MKETVREKNTFFLQDPTKNKKYSINNIDIFIKN